jgi:hypothetical protein
MRLVNVDSLYHHLFTCSDGRICPNTDIDNWPIQFDVKTIKKIIREEPIVFDIPNNPTNGDVIKAIFPNTVVDDYDYGKDPVIDVYGIDAAEYITLRKAWWDAPYQKGGSDEVN